MKLPGTAEPRCAPHVGADADEAGDREHRQRRYRHRRAARRSRRPIRGRSGPPREHGAGLHGRRRAPRDGGVTVWSGTQKTHTMRQGVAALAGVPLERARVIWVSDAGSYGRGGLEETAAPPCCSRKRPAGRCACSRCAADNDAMGPEGARLRRPHARQPQDGRIVALDATLRQFNGSEIFSQPNTAGNFMAGQMAGLQEHRRSVRIRAIRPQQHDLCDPEHALQSRTARAVRAAELSAAHLAHARP